MITKFKIFENTKTEYEKISDGEHLNIFSHDNRLLWECDYGLKAFITATYLTKEDNVRNFDDYVNNDIDASYSFERHLTPEEVYNILKELLETYTDDYINIEGWDNFTNKFDFDKNYEKGIDKISELKEEYDLEYNLKKFNI